MLKHTLVGITEYLSVNLDVWRNDKQIKAGQEVGLREETPEQMRWILQI